MTLIKQLEQQIITTMASDIDSVMQEHNKTDIGTYLATHLCFTTYGQLDDIYSALTCAEDDEDKTDENLEADYPRLANDIKTNVAGERMFQFINNNEYPYQLFNGGGETIDDVFTDYENYVNARY